VFAIRRPTERRFRRVCGSFLLVSRAHAGRQADLCTCCPPNGGATVSATTQSNGQALLETQGLVKRYGGRTVVDHVSYRVAPGEIVGLLGRTGAGKTTSFRMTIGMITPNDGRVFFRGEEVTDLPMYKRAKLGMGYLSQEPSIFQRLTVEQNLLAILETVRGFDRRERKRRAAALLEQFGLTIVRHQHARTLSGGERRKLEIARAMVTEPALMLLDEPFSGVDPIAVEELQTEIRRLRQEHGIAILLTDHNVRETLSVTDRSYIIFEGRVLKDGAPRDLINDPQVRSTYLGSTFRGDEFDEQEKT
jgi:lipopolysaccharide export system ATP-binding protein